MITNILRVLFTRSFKPLAFTNKGEYKLDLEVEELGIYVHIPFCRTLCPFCPYNKTKYNGTLALNYKEALIKEINIIGSITESKRKITSVYFGGGTPALMIDELGDIMGALKANFNISKNIGIELHPRDINENNLAKLRALGFDMVSVGIQSFQSNCLEALDREYIDGAEKVALAKAAGFKTIDVDLIFGIPAQREEDLRADFLSAFKAGATQVSTYPFIDFSYANNKNKPLGKEEKKKLLRCLENTSKEIACDRTSVWTFGERNVQKYSSITRDNFIGFGASATTLLKDIFKINTFSTEEYIKAISEDKVPTALTLKFNERTRALYWLFWNSYTLKLNNEAFRKLFGKKLDEIFDFELKAGRILGMVKKVEAGYDLTKRGAYIYHLLGQSYTHQYIDNTWRIAMENPWPEEIKLY